MCVCVFYSFWTSSSLDVPAGVTQEEGHTGCFTHLPSAVRALIFLATEGYEVTSELPGRPVVITYTCSKSMDQPGKVANPAHGQLNRGNEYFPVPVCA